MARPDLKRPGQLAGREGPRRSAATLVDGHVHLHRDLDQAELFESARGNFRAARRRLGLASRSPDMLLLTETRGRDGFTELLEGAESAARAAWTFRHTHESDSLVAGRGGVDELILVAGRQIATREGLEVLAVGCRREWRDGQAIEEVLAQLREAEALAVVPWGFGKWWFRRGRLLAALLDKVDPKWFFLGDNGGRFHLAPQPRLFALAAERGIRVLPGTDPLPLPRQARRVGSYGFVLQEEIDVRCPGEDLHRMLRNETVTPEPFGERARLTPFVRDQLAMQLRKLAGGSRA